MAGIASPEPASRVGFPAVALSEDQKAMLRLLAQRGEQGYEDIAALKGLSVDDVRAQVRDAVTQLEDEGLPPPALPLDPKPTEPAATGPAKPAPSAPEPPKAEPEPLKASPAAPAPAAAESTPSPAPKSGGPKIAFPSDPGMRGAILAGVLVVIALVAVLVISGGDGDSGDSTSAASDTAQEAAAEGQNTSASESRKVTKAVLSPVDGSEATGVAIFGRFKKTLALQVEASGLEPTESGQAYAVWLTQSPQKMLPLASTPVDAKGKIGAQFEVPIEVLGYLANETFRQITITLVDEGQLKASLKKATKEKKSPEYTGTEVLTGTVTGPIVGAASR
jgi:hypothetical protein